jgi:hypothetical protein
MAESRVAWTADRLPGGVLRLAFVGRGGLGSEGNPDGKRMQEAIRAVLGQCTPAGLVIDLTGFEYRFGNWIGAVPLAALKPLGNGRVCLLAAGETAEALRALWEPTHLGRLVPIFVELVEALRYLAGSALGSSAAEPPGRRQEVDNSDA